MITEKGPKINVMPPGPKSNEIMKLKDKYVSKSIGIGHPIIVKEAKGALIKDVDDNVYIDFAGGIGVVNAGHCPDRVVNAIKNQADNFLHLCFSVTPYESFLNLAKKMVEITPDGLDKCFFVNAGAEAVENSIKIAINYTNKNGILCFDNGFHGRTQLTMTLTGKNKPYKHRMRLGLAGIDRLPFPYSYRCMGGKKADPEICCDKTLEYIDYKLKTHYASEEVAAMIVEPIKGEGGFTNPPKRFFPELKKMAEENDVLFIFDEIQTGFGRTGKMFAMEHFNVVPDIMCFAKSLAAGLPISGVIGKEELMDCVHVGGLGGTYGGNPVACAAALETIDIIKESLPNSQKIGELLHKRFNELKGKYSLIGDVRGLGPMIAMELVKDRETQTPAAEETMKIIKLAREKGLLLLKAGVYGNAIRVLVPIVAEENIINQGVDILEEILKEVSS